MPVCNASRYLKKSIKSVLNQSFRAFELIICDDGSTDGSYEIAKQYQKEDSRIRLLRNSQNWGVARTRNKILAAAVGKYIAPHDADDIMLAGRFAKGVEVLDRNPDIGVVCGHAITVEEKNRKEIRIAYARKVLSDRQDKITISGRVETYTKFPHGSATFRTKLVREAGGYLEHLKVGEDEDLFRRLWEKTNFYAINQIFYIYRIHSKSLTVKHGNL